MFDWSRFFSRHCLLCIYCSLFPPTHTVYVSLKNIPLLGLLEVILGNIQSSRKSLEADGLLKSWIIAFQCKITLGMPRTSQECWYFILTACKRVGFPVRSIIITAFPLMKGHTKDETGAGGRVGERWELRNCLFMADQLPKLISCLQR